MKTVLIKASQNKKFIINDSGDYQIKLTGRGAHVDILGGFHLKNKDKLDVNVSIIHGAKNTSANTFIRAVVEDRSSANINGKIIVKKGAQQTNSFLTENVLLVGKNSKATAIPDLEIEADDVKCSHAATVGKINDEQLFYLMSRGLTRSLSKQIIIDGFLKPINEKIEKGVHA